jgi:hypothetical protein
VKKFDTALLILIVLDRETIAVTGCGACMWRQRGYRDEGRGVDADRDAV